MFYERKVKYLNYYEGKERVRGGGFVKLEVRDGSLRMEAAITGLHHTDTFTRDVELCGRGREKTVGRIEIAGGKGYYRQQWNNLADIGDTGIHYKELQGIRIPLGAGREISCKWQVPEDVVRGNAVYVEGEAVKEGTAKAETEVSGRASQRDDGKEDMGKEELRAAEGGRKESGLEIRRAGMSEEGLQIEEVQREGLRQERVAKAWKRNAVTEKRTGGVAAGSLQEEDEAKTLQSSGERTDWEGAHSDNAMEKEKQHQGNIGDNEGLGQGYIGSEGKLGQGSVRDRKTKAGKRPIKLMEDKWQQLWEVYPHIRPFQDQREYLSIVPSDFVLFPSASYRTVNNSFLLHGYYNYQHLILTKVERKGDSFYYIGVPGNFFEKEKQVAIMFGFESFECAQEPAQPGDFGYYMMRTQI